jgi:DNA repair protein RecN (Recombination protein N)
MLKDLRLKNIVLVESAVIEFTKGFNVLSGESGSGKSAIMNALNLIAGDRSDPTYIRRGADKGIVEAIFDIDSLPHLNLLLDEAGVDHEPGSDLLIRRELSSLGKSRAFINNQPVQLTLLRQVSDLLFEVVGQHANQKLLSLEYHRNSLDLFGDLQSHVKAFAESWDEELHTQQTLEQLISSEAQRMRQIEICRMEIEELLEANLKEGEEEGLFAEYTQLSNADELLQHSSELNRILQGEKGGVLPILHRQKHHFEQLVSLSPSLSESFAAYENAVLELQEVARTLQTYEARIEHNPARAEELNVRLEHYARLKRKYGNGVADILRYLKESQSKLLHLENADDQILELQEHLKALSQKNHALASQLTQLRRLAAGELQKAIVEHLRALNMPKVEISVDVSPQKRTRHGDDKIEIFITPNVGEHRVSLRECASGGELSRMMLAMQAVLAGKECMPTLIFDEIDANIGGETAKVVGEKLCSIGSRHQVLCITHFPQVAKFAEHHLRISKQEIDGRTLTLVESLDKASHHQELVRMLGGPTK